MFSKTEITPTLVRNVVARMSTKQKIYFIQCYEDALANNPEKLDKGDRLMYSYIKEH